MAAGMEADGVHFHRRGCGLGPGAEAYRQGGSEPAAAWQSGSGAAQSLIMRVSL